MATTRNRAASSSSTGTDKTEKEMDILAQKIVEKLLSSETFSEKLNAAIHQAIHDQFSEVIKDFENKVSQLEIQLKESISHTEDILEAHEQYTRRNSLRIYGVPEQQREKNDDVVRSVCEKLGVPLQENAIDVSHRLRGKEGVHRPIIVRFVQRSIKKLVYNNKSKLKGTKIVIREDLTRKRVSLLKVASERYGYKNIWTNEGGFFCKGWSEEWVVLYEDSTIAFYADKGLSRPRGWVRIREAPDLLAVGEWTRQVPRSPRIPRTCHIGQLLVVGCRYPHEVHWLMAQSPAEVNDWMTAISNTLPPPPHLPLENKRCSLTPLRDALPHTHNSHSQNKSCSNNCSYSRSSMSTVARHDNDHTVLSGVVIDWGHGWGWGQSAWATQAACTHDAAISTGIYCHAADDYAVSGYDEVDWSAFGDFCF